jgi:hypothetical protein
MDNLESISKAIAGGIAGLLIAELSRYGFHPVGLEYRILGLTCRFAVSGSIMLRSDTRW